MQIPDTFRVKPVKTRNYCWILLVALVVAILYYPLFRADALPRFFQGLDWLLKGAGIDWLPQLTSLHAVDSPFKNLINSFPSLAHAFITVLAVNLVCLSVQQLRKRLWLSVFAIALVMFEACFGWFSWLDVLALLAGAGAAQTLLVAYPPQGRLLQSDIRLGRAFMCAGILGTSLLAMGSYVSTGYYDECARFNEEGDCEEYKKPGVPIYITYERLRSSVAMETARAPDRLGRVYLYQNYVFLNERNEGIHIIDNQDPSAPVNVGFIRIPGNTEIAVRDNYLYADSYVDLITLDLNDPANISLIARQQDIFPWDAFQNIPNNVSFSSADTDPSLGVIVSYRLSESE